MLTNDPDAILVKEALSSPGQSSYTIHPFLGHLGMLCYQWYQHTAY